MIKIKSFFGFLLCIHISILYPMLAKAQNNETKTVGFSNPSPDNIQKIIFLKEQNIAKNIKFLAIYHQSQQAEIDKSRKIVQENSASNYISFYEIKGNVALDKLFEENEWTHDFEEIFTKTNAFVLFGGADIPPKLYGEKTFLNTYLTKEYRNWEVSLLFHFTGGSQNPKFTPLLEKRKTYPILGICLGMQELCVASGGTLYQDIPAEIYGLTYFEDIQALPKENIHKNYTESTDNTIDVSYMNFHSIDISTGNHLFTWANGRKPLVSSVHHQAVKKCGNYEIVATSSDKKVVEAMIHKKYSNIIGIQFHIDFLELFQESDFQLSINENFKLEEEDKNFYLDIWRNFFGLSIKR